ncbi:MAG: type I-C CRISPR-associated endonuclease Cas1c [Dehalococcoidia bacterium]
MFELLNTLYIQAQGASLGLDHDTVRVRIEGEEASRFPLARIDSLVLFGNVSVTPFLIHRCGEDGRPISWLTRAGRFRGRLSSPTRGNVLLRRQQHEALGLPEWTTRIARQVVAGKLQNSRLVILRAGRESSGDPAIALAEAAGRLGAALKQLPQATHLDGIRGIEGEGARAYFGVFGHMVRSGASAGRGFDRSRRPPRDGANALLSFLYALLREECVAGLESVGLDPQVGYLHTLRPGRPALALDLMEEFRPLVADRLALTLINRRQLGGSSFEVLPHGGMQLTDEGRKKTLAAWRERKERMVEHRMLKSRVPIGLLPHIQARLLARHLRGDLAHYPPFLGR